MRCGVQVLKTPFHPISGRLLSLVDYTWNLFNSVIQQRKHGSFYQGAEQINNNNAFLQIKKDHGGWWAYPEPSRHLFLELFVFSCLLLLLYLILGGNKLIGMLHGLKKLWFSTSNTCKESGDKTTAAQRQNSIVLCPSALNAVYWRLRPLLFLASKTSYFEVLFTFLVKSWFG